MVGNSKKYFLQLFVFVCFSEAYGQTQTLSIFNEDNKIKVSRPTYVKKDQKLNYIFFEKNAAFNKALESSRLKASELSQCAGNFIKTSLVGKGDTHLVSIEGAIQSCEKYYDVQQKTMTSQVQMTSGGSKNNIIIFRDSPPGYLRENQSVRIVGSSYLGSNTEEPNCLSGDNYKSSKCKRGIECMDPSCNSCFRESQEKGLDLIPSENIGNRQNFSSRILFKYSANEDVALLLENMRIPKSYATAYGLDLCIPCPLDSVRDNKNYCRYQDNECDPFLESYDSVTKKCKPKFCPKGNESKNGQCVVSCETCKNYEIRLKNKIDTMKNLKPLLSENEAEELMNKLPDLFHNYKNEVDGSYTFKYPEQFEKYKSEILGGMQELHSVQSTSLARCESSIYNRMSKLSDCVRALQNAALAIWRANDKIKPAKVCGVEEVYVPGAIPDSCVPKVCLSCQKNRHQLEEAHQESTVLLRIERISLQCDKSVFLNALSFLSSERKTEITNRRNQCLRTKNASSCKHIPDLTEYDVFNYLRKTYGVECLPSSTGSGGAR